MARLIVGVNDLATVNPEPVKEVSPNSEIKATEVTAGSHRKLLWRCNKGHEWEAAVYSRSGGRGCPYCSNRVRNRVRNTLMIESPNLAKEVSPNSKIKATEVTVGSHKKLLWKNSSGYEWEATVADRCRCRRRRRRPYYKKQVNCRTRMSLATTNPELAKEVSPNSKIKATEVTAGSRKKLLWKCSKGHEWESSVKSRAILDSGCPYCVNKKVLPGFNDLETVNPELGKEVSPNSEIKATEVTAFSSKKLLWRCNKSHEWKATVNGRSSGSGCPECSGSKMERDFAQLIKTLLPENTTVIRNDRKLIKPYELDVLIPSLNLAFEFNGDYWHSNEMIRKRNPQFASSKQFDDFKKRECEKQGIKLFFIREKQWVSNHEKTIERIKRIIAKVCP